MGRGVIKAQVSSRSSCTAGRSAAEADETSAATHAKTKGIIRKKFLGILLPALLVSRKEQRPPKDFKLGGNLLICINEAGL
jgi:hypothetical protein